MRRMTARSSGDLIALDLLRFACALAVLGYHFAAADVAAPSEHARAALAGLALPQAGVRWSWWGWIGVELFFVISGYVIARSAEGRSAGAFLRRRALRLYPAAWLCASASLCVLLAAHVAAPEQLAARWARSMALSPIGRPIDGSYWTLAVEIPFYLVVAAALGRRGRAERIEAVGIGLGALGTAYWLFAAGLDSPDPLAHMTVQLIRYGPFFALGIAAAAHHARPGNALRRAWMTALTGVAAIEIAAHAAERASALRLAAGPGAPLLAFAAGLLVLFAAPALQPRLRSARTRSAATLGLSTYPLYLFHQDGGAALIGAGVRLGIPYGWAAGLVALGLIALACRVATTAEPAVRGALASGFTRAGRPRQNAISNAA